MKSIQILPKTQVESVDKAEYLSSPRWSAVHLLCRDVAFSICYAQCVACFLSSMPPAWWLNFICLASQQPISLSHFISYHTLILIDECFAVLPHWVCFHGISPSDHVKTVFIIIILFMHVIIIFPPFHLHIFYQFSLRRLCERDFVQSKQDAV